MNELSISEKYDNFETEVIEKLESLVLNSKTFSKFWSDALAIPVNVFDYVEAAILNGELVFLNNVGGQHSLLSDCNISDLVDIITKYEEELRNSAQYTIKISGEGTKVEILDSLKNLIESIKDSDVGTFEDEFLCTEFEEN